MDENVKDYFMGLGLLHQLQWCQDTWGVRPTLATDLVYMPKGVVVLVASAGITDAILAAELMYPPPCIYTTRLKASTDVRQVLGTLLWLWAKGVKEHIDEQSV